LPTPTVDLSRHHRVYTNKRLNAAHVPGVDDFFTKAPLAIYSADRALLSQLLSKTALIAAISIERIAKKRRISVWRGAQSMCSAAISCRNRQQT
jgi:hypothetical protein